MADEKKITEMSTAELLTAACERLETLLAAPALIAGPWEPDDSEIYGPAREWVGETLHLGNHDATAANSAYVAAMNPVVGRALLGALRDCAGCATEYEREGINAEPIFREEAALARAILDPWSAAQPITENGERP